MESVAPRVTLIIPALNEEEPIAAVVQAIPRGWVRECIVVDNGSTDGTAAVARAAGARVVAAPARGYGRACAAGVAAADPASDILAFLDGDGSDNPAQLPALLAPVINGTHDFVIGSRTRGRAEPGSMLPSQVLAAWLAGRIIHLLYGVRYTDMAPMRVIRRDCLEQLRMSEMTYGWNLEMQMKAAQRRLRILEVPVDCRRRQGGVSKVSGSLRASIKTAWRLVLVVFRVGSLQRLHARNSVTPLS